MTRFGYVRVSTTDQNPERQIIKMVDRGIERQNIFVDKCSGKNFDRPSWRRLMSRIIQGDEITIDSINRLGRNYDAVTAEWRRITREEGCDIVVLDFDFLNSAAFRELGDMGRFMEDNILNLFAYIADSDRKQMLQQQSEGIAVAKAAGKYRGGTPKSFPADVIDEANAIMAREGKSAAARFLGVSYPTIYRMISDGRLSEAA